MNFEKDFLCDCDVIHPEEVEKAKKSMPQISEIQKLSDFYRLFGDPTRSKIMWALDCTEMCVCDLAVLLNMTKSAISHQLRALKDATLVKCRKEGKVVFYSLADDHIKTILEMGLDHIREER